MKLKYLLLLLFIGASVSSSFSQKYKVDKADEEFDKYDFIDAREIYLEVINEGFDSAEILKKLGDTYYYNSDYGSAVKWYQRLFDKYPNAIETEYYYRAAQSYKTVDDLEASEKLMNTYYSKGGEDRVVEVFDNDPAYLKTLGIQPFKYVITEAAINSKFSDFGPSYADNDQLIFAASTKDLSNFDTHNWNNLPYLDLFIAKVDGEGGLYDVKTLQGDVNTKYHESSSTITKDGSTMYFTRNNFTNNRKDHDKDRTIRLKLYRATKTTENTWGNVVEIPFNDNEYSVAHPALSLNEKRLYFSSDMPGTFGRSDIWYVDIVGDNKYGPPVNLGPLINTKARETFPFISENNILYFSGDGHGGYGGLDVYIAPLTEEGKVDKISNFGTPINTNKDDFGFITKESTKSGYFTSNRTGGRGSIDDEIYHFVEVCVMTINGVVKDIDTDELLPNSEVTLLDENNNVMEKVIVNEDAAFSFTVECDTKYKVIGNKKSYYPKEKIVETPDEGGVVDIILELKKEDPCPPNDLGCRLSLQPIYFDYDEDYIRPDAAVELAKILAAMRLYPDLVIHIESHTDSRGSARYNEKLSERRAQSTRSWIVDRGIEGSRISAKGYGESQLINLCDDDAECSEEEHQLNRRSMFIIQD
ncbi:OmpA family protein [Cochleicola gelatinilyticus]|uniref:Flagellar motor protein MotB n=1 Tax=Cochleicola gelatinilyticus TaxID=1763537 RepID=A0A167KAU2_9FLAO|nr:OmpA family protein [Cochleicola gelatinilyticus]OAB81575.1 flagellar motor protein MotB [Cochleicola gelatinilyticus]